MKTLLASLFCLASLALVAAPANDDFANRIDLVSSGSISTTGANAGATHQAGDPQFYNRDVVTSVWWSWTCSATGPVTVNTLGSSFDTLLAVCAGSDITALTTIASNDDFTGLTSQVTFNGQVGVSYSIMVAGYNGASGVIKLAISLSGTGCSYAISPSTKSFSYTATNGIVAITASAGCVWSAVSNDSWITITSGSSGVGSWTVAYSVAANTLLTSRTGTMTIAGLTCTIIQSAAPGCTYGLSPPTAHYDASPITNTVAMTAGSGCAWTATPNQSWLTIASGGSGTGNGTITYIVATNSLSNQRVATITAAGQTHTVTQDGAVPCTFAISPSTAPFAASGGTSNIVVSTLTGCTWTASSPASWVTFSTTNGTGNGTVTYTVAANTVTVPRSTILTVAGNSFTVTQAAAACSYTLTSSSLSAAATASSSTVGVTTTTGCAWIAVANVSWLTITAGSSGSGSGTVSFAIAANLNTTTRAGTLTIAGQTFTVNQAAAPCIYSIAPTSAHFSASAQGGSVAVTAGTGCAWTAVSNTGFITVNSGTPGSGNGTVAYSVGANVSTSSRTGTMTIAGQTFTVTQDGTAPCTYSISPTSCACASTAGTASIAVTANAGCAWSVTSSDPTWLTFSPASGTGNGTVVYTITANPSSIPRTATLTIAGQVFTVQQSGIGCTFTVAPTSASYTFVGGSGTATVTATAGCNWSSTSDSSWLVITAGSSGVGNGTVSYTVSAQSVSASRTGRLTIAGRTLIVTQTGIPCSFTIAPSSASVLDFGSAGTFSLNASASDCVWGVTTNAPWISASPTSGTGSTTINFNVLPTSQTVSRAGTITAGGQVFTITQSGDTTVPVVTLTVPANGSTISNTIFLTATATDDVTVARVDFYYDSAIFIGSSVSSPYIIPFQTTNISNASHTFYARAFDSANNQGTSATNAVTVSNSVIGSATQWAQRFGGTGGDSGAVVAIDSSGNIITAGTFDNTITFGTNTFTSAGGRDLYLAKFNSAGTLQWAKHFGSTGSEAVNSIALNSANAIFLGGTFSGTGDLGGGPLTSAGFLDGYVAEYASDGTFAWVKAFGGPNDDVVTGISLDLAKANVVLTGRFAGTLNMGGTNLVSTSGGTDTFLAKFSTNSGTHVWSKNFPSVSFDSGMGVFTDSSDNILLAGYFSFKVNLGGGNMQVAGTNSANDIYLGKFAADSSYIWQQHYGGTFGDTLYCANVDTSGNLLVAGAFSTRTDLGTGTITGTGSSTDMFLAKYSNTDGSVVWVRPIYCTKGGTPLGIAVDSSGNIVVTGFFFGVSNFGSGSVASVLDSHDIFVAKYSSASTPISIRSFGSSGSDTGSGVAISASDYPVVTGSFAGTVNFFGNSLVSAGFIDAVLMRLNP